jgi:anaerobic sulfite reductase subunit B
MATNPYIPKKAKITNYYRESPDSFTITLDYKVKHEPGQFIQVTIPGIGEAPISICSNSDKFIKLNIREVGNVTNALAKLKKGDFVFVRGPYGNGYPMGDIKGKELVVIGGGCGLAPLKGVLDYIETNKSMYSDVMLFLGFRSPDDILFKREIKNWHKIYNTNMTVDSVPKGSCYSGSVGYVTNLVNNAKFKSNNNVALLCGPPIMIKLVIEILNKKGFADNHIYISAERLMHCGIGKCGHCMIHGKYVCTDGPVFRYDQLKGINN